MNMKMKRYEPIYREFYDLLQELMKIAHGYGRLTDIPFRPRDKVQRNYLEDLQREKKAVKYKIVTEPHNFDFLEIKAENPQATLYSVDILQPNFDKLLKECEEFFGSNTTSSIDIKDQFGFEGKKFWLKRVAGQNLTINFIPTKGETTDPFCLMQAFVDYARNNGELKNDYLTVIVPIPEIVNYLTENYPNLKPSDWKTWIRFTRNNLLQKMGEGDKKLIVIKNFDKQAGGYPFSIKIPMKTPHLHQV